MQSLMARGRALVKQFMTDSLLRNAVYLFASTAVMAVLGFAFWLFVARLYQPADIGVASALIAATILVGNLSMLGLNSGLIRFLPESKRQSPDINAALLAATGASVLAGGGYLLVTALLGANEGWDPHNPLVWLGLIGVFVVVTLNSLTDGVFIANRKAQYHLAVYSAFGVTRLLLPVALVSMAATGVFLAYVGAVVASLALSFYFMVRACGYEISARPNWGFIRNSGRYVLGNYLSTVISGVPGQILPTILVATSGATNAAYFSLALTMANLLFIIPTAVSQSMLAESAHRRDAMLKNLLHAVRILVLTLTPVIAAAILLAHWVLGMFGSTYAAGSTTIFQLLAIATIFVAINSVSATILNLKQRPLVVVAVQLVIAVVTLGLVWAWGGDGLVGIGWAMICGYAAGSISYVALIAEAAIRQRRFL